jgi:hypothetical protein
VERFVVSELFSGNLSTNTSDAILSRLKKKLIDYSKKSSTEDELKKHLVEDFPQIFSKVSKEYKEAKKEGNYEKILLLLDDKLILRKIEEKFDCEPFILENLFLELLKSEKRPQILEALKEYLPFKVDFLS